MSHALRIAMVGTRGVPAAYGGFETAVEEIGRRLVDAGHEVVVYCRGAEQRVESYLGMELVHLPAVNSKVAETLSHTALSAVHIVTRRRPPDVAFVFNAANSPFLPILSLRGVPTALHMDGLEWKRGKWGRTGRRYYQFAERLGVRFAGSLIADAQGISDYYRVRYGADTELLTYGAPIVERPASNRLKELELESDRYHLLVARFEPENHVDVIVEGFNASSSTHPLIVVGSAPYSAEYTRRIEDLARSGSRVRLLGGVWDQELLTQLYGNARTYLHGHSVGGTNPSLLRAMGSGTAVIAFDVEFNREVLAETGRYFADPAQVAEQVDAAESDSNATRRRGAEGRDRARSLYDWDQVAAGYGELAMRLAGRTRSRARSTGRAAELHDPAPLRESVRSHIDADLS